MKKIQKINFKAFAIIVGFFSCFTIIGCKEKQTINADLIPPVDNINTFETKDFDLNVTVNKFDSLYTSDPNYLLMALGKISNDPFFGATDAGIYMQFRLPNLMFSFPAGTYDSVVLHVPYYIDSKGAYEVYGDTSNTMIPIKLNAYPIIDPVDFERDKLYYSFDSLAINHNPIGSGIYTLKNLTDTTVLANGDTVRNMLRMKLSDNIKNFLINTPASALDFHTNFAKYFKGIYLAPEKNSAGSFLGLFRLDGGDDIFYNHAQLTYYYRATNDTVTSKLNMKINPGTTLSFNRIQRDYAGTPAANFYNRPNADSILIQGYPGFRTEVEIKLDNKIPDAIVNKATLELTVLNVGMDGFFRNPEQLLVVGIDEDGKEYTLADRLSHSGGNSNLGMMQIGGTPFVTTINTKTYIKYHINIPREVQNAVIAKKEKLRLRIYSSTAQPSFFRMVAGGPNAAEDERLNFHVIYSNK